MDGAQTVVSVVSGGLAGALVSVFSNRIFHWRALRTQFHPQINNIMGEYAIRFEKPEGRYWMGVVGKVPLPSDVAFVNHRTKFLLDLPQFNELHEARELRRAMMITLNPDRLPEGSPITTDLLQEYQAILKCLEIVEKKLKL